MAQSNIREQTIEQQHVYDLVIVGGGITGAGVFKRACQFGLSVLLVEQQDYAWGTSSRSSKMVHGGLRYLASGQFHLTYEAVTERGRLQQQLPYLIEPLSFTLPHYQGEFPPPKVFNSLLWLYDLMAGQQHHKFWQQAAFSLLIPNIKQQGLVGGSQFYDAITDDARLVQRLINEGIALGGTAKNYHQVLKLDDAASTNIKLLIKPQATPDKLLTVQAKAVVNATGAWCKTLANEQLAQQMPIRPLRGSHLIVPSWRFPVASALTVIHPKDKRPMFVYPWLGSTVIGTTDLEHQQDLNFEPKITPDEYHYLIQGVNHLFPSIKLVPDDIISCMAGVRPVVSKNLVIDHNKAPSSEKRDFSVWQQGNIVHIAGGKLTTFDVIAKKVIKQLSSAWAIAKPIAFEPQVFSQISSASSIKLPDHKKAHIADRYSVLFTQLSEDISAQNFSAIGATPYCLAEVICSAKHEQVLHLDDLMLRRTRLGNLLPAGGVAWLQLQAETLCDALNWSDEKWQFEVTRYHKTWLNYYSIKEIINE